MSKDVENVEKISMRELCNLWNKLSDIPFDQEGESEEDFIHFNKGEHLYEIWEWFEDQHPEFKVGMIGGGTISSNHPFMLDDNLKDIDFLIKTNSLEKATEIILDVLSYGKKEEGVLDIVNMISSNDSIYRSLIHETGKKDLPHINHNMLLVLDLLKSKSPDLFSDVISQSDALGKRIIVESSMREMMISNISISTCSDIVGNENVADLMAIKLKEAIELGDRRTIRLNMEKIGQIAERFPVIDYIYERHPDIGELWDESSIELLDFIDELRGSTDKYNYSNIMRLFEGRICSKIEMGVCINSLKNGGASSLDNDYYINDLKESLSLFYDDKTLHGNAGQLTSHLFINIASDFGDFLSKDDLRNIMKNSKEFSEILSVVPESAALSVIKIDPYNDLFRKIKWKDRSVARHVVSNDFGL